MPYSSTTELPASFKNQDPAVKRVALRILNALIKDGMDEGKAISIALTKARQFVAAHGTSAREDTCTCNFCLELLSETPGEEITMEEKLREMIPDDLTEEERADVDAFIVRVGDEIAEKELPAFLQKIKDKKAAKDGKKPDEDMPEGKAKTKEEEEACAPKGKKMKEEEEPITYDDGLTETEFSTDQRKTLAKSGAALPDGSFPIRNKSDLSNAIHAFGRAGNKATAKAHIIKRANALGSSDMIPDNWKVKEEALKEGFTKFSFSESAILSEAVDGSGGTVWDVRCIAAGLSKNKTYYSKETLQEAVQLFSGVPCFADHSREGSRSMKDVVGWFEDPTLREDGIYARFNALESTPWFLGPLKEAYERGNTTLIGFSINGEGARRLDRVDGQLAYIVDRIRAIESVDGVINPSAGGKLVKLVAERSGDEEEELMALEDLTLDELKKTRPDLFDAAVTSAREELEKTTKEAEEKALKEQAEKEAKEKAESEKLQEQERAKADPDTSKLLEDAKAEMTAKLEETTQQLSAMRQSIDVSRSAQRVTEMLGASALPKVLRDKLTRRFDGQVVTDEQIKEAIEDEAATFKALQDERPQSMPSIEMGDSQKDRAIKALDGLLAGSDVDGVQAARTLREAYAIWHGQGAWVDVDAHKILRESYTRERDEKFNERLTEGVSDGTGLSGFTQWGEVLSDRIHKRLLDLYRMPYLEDWRKICSSIVSVPDFKTQRRIRVGGYGTYVTVAEAASYATAATPTDEEASYVVTKYGRLEQLTLEAIANDDVGALRRIPEQLARGAKHTIYEKIFDLLRKNPNVTYEAVGLINSASHLNAVSSGTVDATLSDANMSLAKRLLREQTELNSSKPLGLSGKTLVIPAELEGQAMRLLQNEYAVSMVGSPESGTATDRFRDINVHRNSFDYIVVPYWTDSASWFVLANPADIPTIEVGFYLGRQEPELFVQDMPNVGSNFDQDVIKYKARVIFGATLLDHRGFIGSSEETR